MGESILVAILGFLGTLLGAYASNRKAAALTVYRLEQLEAKVNKHNQVVERTYQLEKHAEVVDEQIKVANHRIEDLEHIIV